MGKTSVAAATGVHLARRGYKTLVMSVDPAHSLADSFDLGGQLLFESDLSHASNKKDWETYSKLAVANVDLYYLNNAYMLNSIAWTFYESVNDKAGLAKAEEWAKKAVDLGMNYANLDTYAAVLYKNGKKELAMENATKALRYARSEQQDAKETEALMEKIKAMK